MEIHFDVTATVFNLRCTTTKFVVRSVLSAEISDAFSLFKAVGLHSVYHCILLLHIEIPLRITIHAVSVEIYFA
jgi:hypothetical protein